MNLINRIKKLEEKTGGPLFWILVDEQITEENIKKGVEKARQQNRPLSLTCLDFRPPSERENNQPVRTITS